MLLCGKTDAFLSKQSHRMHKPGHDDDFTIRYQPRVAAKAGLHCMAGLAKLEAPRRGEPEERDKNG